MEGNFHKKIRTTLQTSITDLPGDVLIEILTRLPLKNLVACKSSCTTLCNSASPDSPFISTLYSSRSPQALALQFKEPNPSSSLHLWDPEADVASRLNANSLMKPFFEIPRNPAVDINYNLRSRRADATEYVLTNSCNGLLYLTRRDRRGSLVCNPVTNEYFFVSAADTGCRSSAASTLVELLGFSAVAKCYKALRIYANRGAGVGAQVQVVGSGCWRNIAIKLNLEAEGLLNVDSVFLNGTSYWISYSQEMRKIVYFNFVEEVLDEIELPFELEDEKPGDRDRTSIGVLGDSLCVSYNNYGRDNFSCRLDFWVMRDASDGGTRWIKGFKIDTMRPRGSRFHGMFKPLQVLNNGEILMLWVGNDLVCYNPTNNSLRLVKFSRMNRRPITIGFTPSFVPLKDALAVKAERIMTQSVRPRCMQQI